MGAIEALRQKLFDKLQELVVLKEDIAETQKKLTKLSNEVNELYEKIDDALDKS